MLRTILIGKTVEQSLFLGLSHCFPFNLSLHLPQRASASTHNWQHLMYLFNSKLIYRVSLLCREPQVGPCTFIRSQKFTVMSGTGRGMTDP